MNKSYYRIMLGRKSKYAEQCREVSFIGVDFGLERDLTNKLLERWQDFNKEFRPIWLEKHPDKSKVSAGLACGFVHTVCKEIKIGGYCYLP